jgi:hypothetical protein
MFRLSYLWHKLLWRWFPPKRDLEMERRCVEAYERGDYKPLSQVIAELREKVEQAKH